METIFEEGNKLYFKKNVTQVRKMIEKNGAFYGITVGNKVARYHFHQGWHLANEVIFHSVEELEHHIGSMLYYLPKELGNKVAFYQYCEVTRKPR